MTSAKDKLGLVVLCICLALLLAVVAGGLALEREQQQLDSQTGQVAGIEPSAETDALFDLTDPIPVSQQVKVHEYFHVLAASGLRANERVAVWTLSGDKDGALQRRFSRCAPSGTVNPWIGNPQLAEAQRESVFAAPLRAVLVDLPSEETSATTPLLEAIGQVCSQPEFRRPGVPRRLVVVSNLEQNDAALSVYSDPLTVSSFTAACTRSFARPDLRGVDVTVLYLPHGRWARSLDPTLQNAWRNYFKACGADSVRVSRL